MYLFICPLSLACDFISLGLKNAGWATKCLGLDWPLSEVGTGLEQQICSSPHRIIIRACLPGPETEHIIIINKLILEVPPGWEQSTSRSGWGRLGRQRRRPHHQKSRRGRQRQGRRQGQGQRQRRLFHWTISSYTNSFIYCVLLLVLISLSFTGLQCFLDKVQVVQGIFFVFLYLYIRKRHQ